MHGGHVRTGCGRDHICSTHLLRHRFNLLFITHVIALYARQIAFLLFFLGLDAHHLFVLRYLFNCAVHKALLTGVDRRVTGLYTICLIIRFVAVSDFLQPHAQRAIVVGDASRDSLNICRLRLVVFRELPRCRARLQPPTLLEEVQLRALLERILIILLVVLVSGLIAANVITGLLPDTNWLHSQISSLHIVESLETFDIG